MDMVQVKANHENLEDVELTLLYNCQPPPNPPLKKRRKSSTEVSWGMQNAEDKNYGVIQTANLGTVCRAEQAAAPSFFGRVDARSIVLDSISADPTIAKAPGGSAPYAPALRLSAAVGNLRFFFFSFFFEKWNLRFSVP
jgi:hypothetical protein